MKRRHIAVLLCFGSLMFLTSCTKPEYRQVKLSDYDRANFKQIEEVKNRPEFAGIKVQFKVSIYPGSDKELGAATYSKNVLDENPEVNEIFFTEGILNDPIAEQYLDCVVAHELGHIKLQHRGGYALYKEMEADKLSVKICGLQKTVLALEYLTDKSDCDLNCKSEASKRLDALKK